MPKLTNISLRNKIGHGAFGEIYECVDKENGTRLAIKIEKRQGVTQLKHEYLIYKKLVGPQTPMVFEYGTIDMNDETCNCMTMEILGLSLEKLFVKMERKFSEKTVFMLGKACLSRIERLQIRHFIHRDIKPDNFVTDLTGTKIYLIDYGLAKYYRHPRTLVHIPIRTDKNLTGTARYASLATHEGFEQSRRDDLESLGFLLVYFLRGRLPWQGLRAETRAEKYSKIKEVKQNTSLFELCAGLPNEIYLYLVYVRNLQFDEAPDYAYLEAILEGGLRKRGMEDDGKWDWLVR